MNIGELTATLGIDTGPLDGASDKVKGFASTAVDAFASANAAAITLTGAVTGLGVALGALGTVGSLVELTRQGFEFNKVMEESAISIASMIGGTQEIRDATGRLLEGQEAWNASQQLSEETINRIKVLALETVATVPELVRGFQSIVGPASQAGISLKEMPVVAQRLAQAMSAAMIPIEQMRTEGRAILTGHITAHDILAKQLGIDKEMVAQWKAQGNFAEQLLKKLEQFSFAGAAAAKTVGGLKSNISDAVQQMTGLATSPAYDQMRKTLQGVLDNLVSIDKEAVKAGKAGIKLQDDWKDFYTLLQDASLAAANLFDILINKSMSFAKSIGSAYVALKEVTSEAAKEPGKTFDYAALTVTPAPMLPQMYLVNESVRMFLELLANGKVSIDDVATASQEVVDKWYHSKGFWETIKSEIDNVRSALEQEFPVIFDIQIKGMWEEFKMMASYTANALTGGFLGKSPLTAMRTERSEESAKEPPGVIEHHEPVPESKLETKPKGAGEGGKKGGGGKGAEGDLKRLENMVLAWEQEIARLTGSGMEQLDAWYSKELQKITELEAKGVAADKARIALDELRVAKQEKLEEDYDKWLAGATKDTLASIELEHENLLTKYEGIKDAEVQIEKYTAMKKYEYFVGLEQKRLDYAQKFNQEMSSLTPFLEKQQEYERASLETQHQIALLTLEKALREKEITPEIYNQAMAYENMTNQARQFNAERKAWQTEGAAGGLKEWSLERAKEASTRGYQETIDLMKNLESTMSEGLSSAIVGSLSGKSVEISEIFRKMVEDGIKRGVTSLVSRGFDELAKVFRGIFGLEAKESPMLTDAKKANLLIIEAGRSFGEQMLMGANAISSAVRSIPPLGIPGEGAGVGGGYGGWGVGGYGVGKPPEMGYNYGQFGPGSYSAWGAWNSEEGYAPMGSVPGSYPGGYTPGGYGGMAGGGMAGGYGSMATGPMGAGAMTALSGAMQGEMDPEKIGSAIAGSFLAKAVEGIQAKLAPIFSELFTGIGETLFGTFTESSEVILGGITTGSDLLDDAGGTIFDFLSQGGDLLTEAGSAIFDFISSAGEGLVSMLGGLFSGMGGGGGGGIFGGILDMAMSFLPFHKGGPLRAHSGLYLGNLKSGETPIIGKAGEYIVNDRAVSGVGLATMDYINNYGSLPSQGRGTSSSGTVVFNNNFRYPMTESEWDRALRVQILPGIERVNASRGGGRK